LTVRPRRIVITTWGSFGDLFPYLELGRALRARGHDVVLATCPIYRDIVAGEGLRFHPTRPDVDPDDTALLARVMDPARGTEAVVREMLVPALRDAYADLSAAADGADLIVAHPVTFVARVVAEERKLPWLSTVLAPTSFFSIHDFPILPPHVGVAEFARRHHWAARAIRGLAKTLTARWLAPLHRLRRERGLAPVGHPLFEGQFSPHGTLALFSRVLGEPQPDWPANATVTGFLFRGDQDAVPSELDAFLSIGPAPIVFTLGSSAVGVPGAFYEESVKAAASLGRRAVLLVGRPQQSISRPVVPAGMMAVDYAPHGALFPRAAAVVHHGGVGTTAQGLRAGCPALIVPHAHDQFDNAARVERLGLGRTLDARRYSADAAAPLLRALLDAPQVAARGREIAAAITAEDGAATAVRTIETTLGGTT